MSYAGTVKDGGLLVELAAREAGRRKHKHWKQVSAADLIEVLNELGFKIAVTDFHDGMTTFQTNEARYANHV